MAKFSKGFSTIELLITLAITLCTLLIVAPYINQPLEKNRATAYADTVKSALKFARVSAITLGEPVTFCGSKTAKTCDGDDAWNYGSIVVAIESGKVWRLLPKPATGVKLRLNASRGKNNKVDFLPTGFTDGQQQGSFFYCPQNPADAKKIVFLPTGRVRIENLKQAEQALCE